MGMAGIPWFTTDIGGFHGGNPDEPEFRELLVRWFQYGTFCPVMRLHGERQPMKPQYGTTGGATCLSGADNEVWSFGEEAYEICKEYLQIRENMRDYTRSLMKEAHEKGTPVMRTLFYEFPQDSHAWEVENEFLFGGDVLVAPILYENQRQREVYLPAGVQWKNIWTGKIYEGGQSISVDAPIEQIPLFVKEGSKVRIR